MAGVKIRGGDQVSYTPGSLCNIFTGKSKRRDSILDKKVNYSMLTYPQPLERHCLSCHLKLYGNATKEKNHCSYQCIHVVD